MASEARVCYFYRIISLNYRVTGFMNYFSSPRGLALVAMLLITISAPSAAETASDVAPVSFTEWLQELREEALAKGISPQILDVALTGLEPDPRVIGFDRNQPEFTQTFEEYLTARVSDERVRRGRELLEENRAELQQVAHRYGVAPRYLVAFWGLESSFGLYQGKYSVIRSLATLAYDPRRSAFFRNELLNALMILQEGHVPPDRLLGGWAGAMGQNQFIPSSFMRYAQDFDGDGHKDIWSNRMDVWASIAFYLDQNGWVDGQEWGLAVALPDGFVEQLPKLMPADVSPTCFALRYHTRKLDISEWGKLGVTRADGSALPDQQILAALIIPEQTSETKPDLTYLVFPNFRTILNYNCANKYAVSVGLMADLLGTEKPD